jgi:DNA repair protein SbcC/Rad50
MDYIQRSQARLQALQTKKQTLEKDVEILLKHIDSLKENSLKYTIFENQSKRTELELKQAVLEEKNTEIFLAELKKELQWLYREISVLKETIKKKEDSKKKLQELNELIDWLSSQFLKLVELVERNVLLKLRKEFSTLFRKWFLMLVPEGSLDSQIDENFTPVVMQGGAEMDYSFLSGGERTAIALAYRLALNQTINSLLSKLRTRGIIILDEPTDGFSEIQITKIRDILEELNAEQLIIVSHEQKIESFVDKVVKISKEGGISVFDI